MFNQRTDPRYQRIREMIGNGELGNLRRMKLDITTGSDLIFTTVAGDGERPGAEKGVVSC